jgi:hypothetical protein
LKCQTKKDVGLLEEMEPFRSKVQALSKQYRGSIFVDGVNTVVISKQQIMEQLQEHLRSHVVVTKGRYGNRYMLQSIGIPQGSVLSSLLCNIYYGDIERRLLGTRFNQHISTTPDALTHGDQKDLLTRMVDDFLLISTKLDDLEHFFVTMYRGDRDLGVNINKDKTSSSVALQIEDATIGNPPEAHFPWCGMLFDTTSGEVRIDYSRFIDGKGGDTLTVDHVNNCGEHLLANMKLFVRPRCLPILFDSNINSSRVRIVNYYQLMVYAAVKTTEYVKHLRRDTPDRTASENDAIFTNSQFLLQCIEHTILFATDLINARVNATGKKCEQSSDESHLQKKSRSRSRFFLPRTLSIWLGWRSFYDVLVRQKRSAYQSIANTELCSRMNEAGTIFDTTNVLTKKKNLLYDSHSIQRIVKQALDDIDLSKLMSN